MSGNQKPTARWCLFFLSVLFTFACFFSSCAVADEVKNPLAIDLVIAIDYNIRMNNPERGRDAQIDPDGLRFDAAASLINMCDAKYSRAGFFLFSDDLYTYTDESGSHSRKISPENVALFNISLPVNRPQRQKLMNTLNGSAIRSGVGTVAGSDIGKALEAAVEAEIANQNNGNRKVILLLSADNELRSAETIAKAKRAREKAVNNGIEIYAVAVKEGSKILQDLATKPENYQLVANVDDLVDVCRTFFADMVGSNPSHTDLPVTLEDGRKEIKLEIPNESVAEVNLIIPLKKMNELELVSGGKPIRSTDDSVLTNQSNNICTYKLIKPKADTYFLHYSTNAERDIVIQYVFSYNIQAVANVENQIISKHLPVKITAGYLDNGEPTKDLKLYGIPAKVTLWKGNNIVVPEKRMSLNEKGDGYTIEYSSLLEYGAGEYTAIIKFDGDGLLRESVVTFTLENDKPELIDKNRNGETYNITINEPRKADTYNVKGFAKNWDLSTFVKDINNDSMHAEIISEPDNVDVYLEGMTLTVTPQKNKAAEGAVTLVVKDTDQGESEKLVFPVKVTNYEDRYNRYTARFDAVEELKKNSSQNLTLKVYDGQGVVVRDNVHFPEQVAAIVHTNSEQREITLSITEDGFWTGELKTDITTADYEVDAEVVISDQVKIKAEPLSVSSGNRAPELKPGAKQTNNWIISINDPGDSSSYDVKNKTWQLKELITDPDGDELTFEVDKGASINDVVVTYNKESKEITLTTKDGTEANGDVVIHCWDNEKAAGPDLVFHVNVSSKEKIYQEYTAKLHSSGHGKNKELTITLSVFDEKGIIVQQDSNMPESIDASYTLDGVQTALPLVRGEDGNWSGTFRTADKEVIYSVKAAVPISKNIKIIPEDMQLSTVNTAPVVKEEINQAKIIPETINIEPFLLWNQETGKIVIEDLNRFFTDADGDELVFDFDSKKLGDNADATIEGSRLTINGLKEAANQLSFSISATDNEGAQAATQPVYFTVKSQQKQGVTTIAVAIAIALVAFILYLIFRPGFHSQFFEVSAKKRAESVTLSQGKSGLLTGKKPVELGLFFTADAKKYCGESITTSLLNGITLAPAYGSRVKVKHNGKPTLQVKIGPDTIDEKKGGTLSPDGTILVEQNGVSVMFKLKQAGTGATPHNTTPGRSPITKTETTRTAVRTRSKSSHT